MLKKNNIRTILGYKMKILFEKNTNKKNRTILGYKTEILLKKKKKTDDFGVLEGEPSPPIIRKKHFGRRVVSLS